MAILLVIALSAVSLSAMQVPNDQDALTDVSVGKALFDINIGADFSDLAPAQGKLALYLNVIKQTYTGLQDQGVTPDIIVVFRGSAVALVTETTSQEIKGLITELSDLGIVFEACNVATSLFQIDNASMLTEINVVGNTFISAIGYGSAYKGYATIPIM
jgi:intracellular sulfur oxidation DsrE/DsrF family protein